MSKLRDDMLHIDDAAKVLCRSTRTVRRLVVAGLLERHVVGGRAYVSKESLEAFQHRPQVRRAETIADLREHVAHLQDRVDTLERTLGIVREVEEFGPPPVPLGSEPDSTELANLEARLAAIHRRTA